MQPLLSAMLIIPALPPSPVATEQVGSADRKGGEDGGVAQARFRVFFVFFLDVEATDLINYRAADCL